MNSFQFTTRDYLAYLQISNHEHVLAESDDRKRTIEDLLSESYASIYGSVNVDDVEYLIHFERPYSNEEKIGYIFSYAVTYPYAHKLIRLMSEHVGFDRPALVPINDILSVTERADEVLNKIVSRNIKAAHLAEVRDYLLQHVDLIDILPFVSRITSEGFKPETELSLELYRDPEVEDTYLTFLARNQQYDERFLETISAVRTGYTDLLTNKTGWILVTTDFESPQHGE